VTTNSNPDILEMNLADLYLYVSLLTAMEGVSTTA
jgi:hypothetical protein